MPTNMRRAIAVLLATLATGAPALARQISIDPLSASSLYLRLYRGNEQIGVATGFVVNLEDQWYLITNWHVLSGRHPAKGPPPYKDGLEPDAVGIVHHARVLGEWVERREALVRSGRPLWIEHPLKAARDVAALRLPPPRDGVTYQPLNLRLAEVDMIPEVAMSVSIIGFPLGLTGPGMLPIWKTGHIASEPALPFQNLPVFLIDATTRGGMSGSPVVLRLSGGFRTASGKTVMGQSGYSTRLLGIYSGRLRDDSEVGVVWRPVVIDELLRQAK